MYYDATVFFRDYIIRLPLIDLDDFDKNWIIFIYENFFYIIFNLFLIIKNFEKVLKLLMHILKSENI